MTTSSIFITVIRAGLTIVLIGFSYKETGLATATCLFLIYVAIEGEMYLRNKENEIRRLDSKLFTLIMQRMDQLEEKSK